MLSTVLGDTPYQYRLFLDSVLHSLNRIHSLLSSYHLFGGTLATPLLRFERFLVQVVFDTSILATESDPSFVS